MRLAVLGAVGVVAVVWAWFVMIRMPGESFRGALPPMTEAEVTLGDALRADVEALASDIGPRSVDLPDALGAAQTYLADALAAAGYDVALLCYDVNGVTCCNIEVTIAGTTRADEIVVVGAHYDSVTHPGLLCPGADDNASGCAATLALARAWSDRVPQRTLRFVLFPNEEPPYFRTADMGSLVYARACRDRGDDVVAMLSLETIGYYSDEPHSQAYPFPLGLVYPGTGDFITFVGNYGSRDLVRQVVGSFRKHCRFPSEGGAIPGFVPGVGWSDHWSFWKAGYHAVMVTDTAPFRYPHYHRTSDTADQIDYDRTARVVAGLEAVLHDLVDPPP